MEMEESMYPVRTKKEKILINLLFDILLIISL